MKETMKAVIHSSYGPPQNLKIKTIDKPIPNENELLINVKASTVTPFDIAIRSGRFPLISWIPLRMMFGFFNPRNLIMGYEFSGVVETVGSNVSDYNQGDLVYGCTYQKMSCQAEFICLPQSIAMTNIPGNLSIIEAAAVPDGASTALSFLELANIKEGHDVLVYGASGSVGTYAVQIAKNFGCSVTAVCSSSNFDIVRNLGADNLIDYNEEDYGNREKSFDIVFDAVGRSSYSQAKSSLKPGGVFVTTRFKLTSLIYGKLVSIISNKKLLTTITRTNTHRLNRINKMIEEGVVKPVIDSQYKLEDIAKAHHYVGKGHKVGNVIIIL